MNTWERKVVRWEILFPQLFRNTLINLTVDSTKCAKRTIALSVTRNAAWHGFDDETVMAGDDCISPEMTEIVSVIAGRKKSATCKSHFSVLFIQIVAVVIVSLPVFLFFYSVLYVNLWHACTRKYIMCKHESQVQK